MRRVSMRRIVPWVAVVFLCFLATTAFSQDILVWDKDHDQKFPDPEGAGNVDATYGVTKALDACGETYIKVTDLPTDLAPYKIIFIVMGMYC